MGFIDFLKRTAASKAEKGKLQIAYKEDGVAIKFAASLPEPTVEALLASVDNAGAADTIFGAHLAQLADEGRCHIDCASALVPWAQVYELHKSAKQEEASLFITLPPIGRLKPILGSSGTLSESAFELEVVGWTDGQREVSLEALNGAVAVVDGEAELLPAATWTTVAEIAQFRRRDASKRTQHENELAWGRIRQVADHAGAVYATPYLETTYVLTPQSLRLPLSKEETAFGRVITVTPTFEGAPDGWLKAYDGFNSVQPHYDLTRGAGRVRVVISDPVRKVLEVIKRDMPGRKVAGSRAEKFVHNPWAYLGETTHDVIRQDEFEADRGEAGSVATNFNVVGRFENGRLNSVDLSITEIFADGSTCGDVRLFTPEQLEKFVAALGAALQEDRERFPWEEYDLTIDAEADKKLAQSRQLLHVWRNQPAERISLEDIYELDGYSGRIEGVGVAKPIYVPVLLQKPSAEDDGEGWLPSDLTPMVRVTLQGQEGQVLIPLSRQWVEDLEHQTAEAERTGKSEISNPSLPTPVSTNEARVLADSFRSMLSAQEQVRDDGQTRPKQRNSPRETLLVKTNLHGVDYIEARKVSLALPSSKHTELPRSLRTNTKLKRHQLHGIAWFQYLVSKGPGECRGALLADDMGLGKTLQLLCLVGWYYEHNPHAAPSVIFAPKSLLENWANEAKKFFTPSFPEVLVLYGDELKARRQPLGLIDEQLKQKQIVDLLKPNWAGNAKVIVTTYEVLTSFEFSFAKQPFAFVICDEAQRIKSPGALVTLAAKKLKADFRIACTGTPVENSLADLWCLFDFIQPGLLGALEEFGKTHRRPIECQTEEHKLALQRLQATISPQILRRTKADISSELPKKYFAVKAMNGESLQLKESLSLLDRLEIPLSEHQRILYKGGLKKLEDASKESDSHRKARLSFGALHLMKAVCAEPYCLPGTKFLVDKGGRETHLVNSPKLRWMLKQLWKIRETGEKAIIFTELREVQAALYYFLRETFGLKPFIVNGDSQNRQTYLDKFSAKEGFDVIILSTLAAGAGLNVTAANHVFHFTRAWNPAKESQATDRAYRIGQERDVFVYCPTMVSDFKTFEVRLDELLKQKANLANTTLDGDAIVSILNGTGGDATFSELVGFGEEGEEWPRRYLTIDDIDRMDGFGFEVICCLLWSRRGFHAQITPKRGGDGGIDIIAMNGRQGEILQCKSSRNAQIGWDAIKEVTAGSARYQTKHPGIRLRKLAVTNQGFTSGAVAQAEANQVHLITRQELEEFLAAHPITNHEFDEALLEWEPVARTA